MQREGHVIGLLSPARLLKIVRQSARHYDSKAYNFLFHNCQDFANHLRQQIAQSMTSITADSERADKRYWTSGDVTLAGATAAAVGVAIWGVVKLATGNRDRKEDEVQEKR